MKKFHIIQESSGQFVAKKEEKYRGVPRNTIISIKAASSKKALDSFNFRVENGSIKLPEIKNTQKPKEIKWYMIEPDTEVKKTIFCDFNGVIDDFEKSISINEYDPFVKLPIVACPHKIFKLSTLALKHNANIVMTSLWRLEDISFRYIIGRCLLDCEIQEYIDFYEENKDKIDELSWDTTGRAESRSFEIKEYIMDFDITHCVVFEDEHDIDSRLNPIMTQGSIGLLDEHIEAADAILTSSEPVSF